MSSWLLGAGRPVLFVLVVVGLFVGGTCVAWLKLKSRILASTEYRLGPEHVEITPTPDWIRSDIRADVFRDPMLSGPLSILDDNLNDRISKAFSSNPWVAKVGTVTRSPPASVKVELVYRRPVCMVQVRDRQVRNGVVAVDAEGVSLPSEGNFRPLEAIHYPLLLGPDRESIVPAGQRWVDPEVVGGAEIAAAFGPAWEPLGLEAIQPLPADPAEGQTEGVQSNISRRPVPFFALWTRGGPHSGRRILWGYAPDANAPGEISAAQKIARLQQYQANNDTLDIQPGQPRQDLDVRKLREVEIKAE